MSLALRCDCEVKHRMTGLGDLSTTALIRRGAGGFDIGPHSHPEVAADFTCAGLLPAEGLRIEQLDSLLETFDVVAAVVADRGIDVEACFVGKLVRLDEVAPAHLVWLQSQFARDLADEALHHEHRVR